MRAPIRAVHFRAAAGKTAREGIVLVSAIVVVVVIKPSCYKENHADKRGLFPQTARLLNRGNLFLFSRVRHEKVLYHDLECRGHDIKRLALQGEHLTIHHHVDRRIELEINSTRLMSFCQGMLDVCAAIIIVPPVNLLLLNVRNKQGR